MKKIVFALLAITTTMPFLLYTVSCGSDSLNYGTDLSKISDYKWSKEEPYFNSYNKSAINASSVEEAISLKIKNESKFLDYKNFNTGFKTSNEVLKQSPTGVPLNTKFLPNGNRKRDVMEVKRNERFDKINSILDWTYQSDLDAKYNKSRIELQKTEKVASKWVSTQDEKIKEMNMSTIIPGTSLENTIVGNKRTYARSFNNYQYNDIMVAWAGAADEGIIVPPGKNEVEKAHINGTKILGNIFLDGYHGLKKEMLDQFLKKDSNGNYLIVDILINIAVDLGFDGWFWNNEPNGYFEDGYILRYKVSTEIMKQFREKVKASTDEKVKNLILFSYKNNGSLEQDTTGKTASQESEELQKNSDYFLSDFGITPNKSVDYLEKNKNIDPFTIYNMYNASGWIGGNIFYNQDRLGGRELKDLVYKHYDENGKEYIDVTKERSDKNLNKWTYKSNDQNELKNSLAIFASQVADDLARQDMDKIKIENQDTLDIDTYGMTKQNYYDDLIYTGRNRQLSENDEGSVSYDEKTFENKSYGVGNLVQEKTVLIDDNKSFFTNFSTGNGSKFASLNTSENGVERIVETNYPWSNSNIADVQPTYKWMITKANEDNQVVDSKNITGFYDYLDPYLKGNSIALGSGVKNDGEIIDAKFENGSEYNWMIMGSNYKKTKNLDVSFVYKSTGIEEPKIIYEEINGGSTTIKKAVSNYSVKELDNGWKEINGTINSEGTVGKIGLNFTANSGSGKINVGQLSIDNNSIKNTFDDLTNIKAESELVINRENGFKNYRLNFDSLFKEKDIYSYYEVYYKKNNELFRVGETNSDNYYIKNIPVDVKQFHIKLQNNATGEIKWIKLEVGE
ncbi:endo-beta-N-acetylglucosaminidase [Spiroplasma diminutum]|uniref:Endo-beta-N-acetylglucosaminidase n=1 Tax=Spiroplasma diminutum CUAS-1 TaxID=1276221 RepID=S5MJG1_9MOLU|nr:endo-beta-N-acetylglucosaminidase [Spiroplasma diminutum]AGR42115.1 endo-beta-N-acetylglucosaminidase [Spiroplasma diminutum CUAS-1]